MALGDALLSTFRTQQIANQQRQANQLAQQRLDVSRQQLGLMEQQEARQAQQFANEEKVRMNDGTFNQMLENGYFDIKTNRFNKEKFRTDIQNGVPAADALALRMAQDKLGMTTPEGFALDKVTRLPNGKFAFGGSYTDGRGVFGEGVLTKDGTSFPDSEIATFENAGDIANAAELYYKTTLLQDSTLAANYPQLAAARELANVDSNLLTIVNAADQAMASGTTDGAEIGRNLLGVAGQVQGDPDITAQLAADVTGDTSILPGSDQDIDSVVDAPDATQPSVSVIDTLSTKRDDINDPELNKLLKRYENLSSSQGGAGGGRSVVGNRRALDNVTKQLESYPQARLEELESQLESAQGGDVPRGVPARYRGVVKDTQNNQEQVNAIQAQIQQHKSDFGLEDAAPISDSVTDPEQQSEIVTAQDQANAVDLTAPDAKEQLETLGQQLSQNQTTVTAVAQGMQTAGINNLNDAQRADLKSKKMIYAFISAMGATDAQKNAAFSSLMNLGETGVESMSAYQAMQLAQNDYANQLSAERNRISRLQANNQMSLEVFERMDNAANWITENVHNKISEIVDPEGEGKELPSNELAERNLQRFDTDIVPQLLAKSAAAQTPEEAQQYLTALAQLTTTYAQNVALTERGGFMETIASSIPFLRGQAQPTFSADNLANVEIDAYDSNGEPVRFKVTGVAGDTRSEKFSAEKIMNLNPTIGKLFISMMKAKDAANAAPSE